MIDIHCHILPQLDDGPQTLEEAISMARIASQDGIRQIVAAPHLRPGIYEPTTEQILARTEELSYALRQEEIPVGLVPAINAHLECDLVDCLLAGDMLTLGGDTQYLLLELPKDRVPPQVESLLHQCLLKRFIPILVHPERTPEIRDDLDRLGTWVAMGVLVQVNAMSLTGGFGRKVQRTVRKMMERRLCHLIASEAHSSGKRVPVLSAAVEIATGILGEDIAQAMVTQFPAQILAGEFVEPPEPVVSRRRWRYSS